MDAEVIKWFNRENDTYSLTKTELLFEKLTTLPIKMLKTLNYAVHISHISIVINVGALIRVSSSASIHITSVSICSKYCEHCVW